METTAIAREEIELLAKRLWALGDLARLRLLSLLPTSAEEACQCNVSQLAERLGMSQPTVSHHLRVLRQAGFVEYTKRCRDCYYWRDPDAILLAADQLRDVMAVETPLSEFDLGPSSGPATGSSV